MSELCWKDRVDLIRQLRRREQELFEELYRAVMRRERHPVPLRPDDEAIGEVPELSSSVVIESHIAEELEHLESIEQALSQAHGGRFGVCVDCGQPIPADTMRRVPWTIRCLQHQIEHTPAKSAEGSFSGL